MIATRVGGEFPFMLQTGELLRFLR